MSWQVILFYFFIRNLEDDIIYVCLCMTMYWHIIKCNTWYKVNNQKAYLNINN